MVALVSGYKSKIVNLAPPGRGDLTEGNPCSLFKYSEFIDKH